jgi:hypothetical protein
MSIVANCFWGQDGDWVKKYATVAYADLWEFLILGFGGRGGAW